MPASPSRNTVSVQGNKIKEETEASRVYKTLQSSMTESPEWNDLLLIVWSSLCRRENIEMSKGDERIIVYLPGAEACTDTLGYT